MQRGRAARVPSVRAGFSRSAMAISPSVGARAAIRRVAGVPRATMQTASGSIACHTRSSAAPRSAVPPGAARSVNQRSAAS
ncbi:MAG: hypothetical protein ACKORL_05045, partial [Phycisphaerales bacterium]